MAALSGCACGNMRGQCNAASSRLLHSLYHQAKPNDFESAFDRAHVRVVIWVAELAHRRFGDAQFLSKGDLGHAALAHGRIQGNLCCGDGPQWDGLLALFYGAGKGEVLLKVVMRSQGGDKCVLLRFPALLPRTTRRS